MSKLITPGRIMFALGILALGILQFFTKDYIIGRPPSPSWSADIPGKLTWAYISGILLVLAALAIIFNVKGGLAAFFTGCLIFVCSFLLRHLPDTFHDSLTGILWRINAYKTLALCGGAFIIAFSYPKHGINRSGKFFAGNGFVSAGCIFLSLFMVMSGLAHFKFDEFVKSFIPAYIPAHAFWTYFTAVALITGGIGLIFTPTRKWAALFSGTMILLWFILLHIPRTAAAPNDYGEWMGVFESFSFSGILFTLAGLSSLKKRPAPGMIYQRNAFNN